MNIEENLSHFCLNKTGEMIYYITDRQQLKIATYNPLEKLDISIKLDKNDGRVLGVELDFMDKIWVAFRSKLEVYNKACKLI